VDADDQAIGTLRAMLAALEKADVPTRFHQADRLLRDAIDKNIRGLVLRNEAIRFEDRNRWAQHAQVLDDAVAAWAAGYEAFPADNRPALRP
jgi:hypothetical protein